MKQGKYLFIRILEACNADCFMCEFAKSKDPYRFDLAEFRAMLPRVYEEGVRYVRFTGGEPLMHRQIIELISAICDNNMQSSIITNGTSLGKKMDKLADAGLNHVIVSIDGLEETHDRLRGTPKLFSKCVDGIKKAKERGLVVRVNTVVGPDNFREMPELQDLLSSLGVDQWELSSLKLAKPLDYKPGDRTLIEHAIIPAIYEQSDKLVPMGKIWCGNTKEERDRYFETGITPSADGICRVVDYVRYLDARNKRLYACSLIPHRVESEKRYPAPIDDLAYTSIRSMDIQAQADFFRKAGPTLCTGCSTTAAGFSDHVEAGKELEDWSY